MDINKIAAASKSIDMDGLLKANHANKVEKGQPLEVSNVYHAMNHADMRELSGPMCWIVQGLYLGE